MIIHNEMREITIIIQPKVNKSHESMTITFGIKEQNEGKELGNTLFRPLLYIPHNKVTCRLLRL